MIDPFSPAAPNDHQVLYDSVQTQNSCPVSQVIYVDPQDVIVKGLGNRNATLGSRLFVEKTRPMFRRSNSVDLDLLRLVQHHFYDRDRLSQEPQLSIIEYWVSLDIAATRPEFSAEPLEGATTKIYYKHLVKGKKPVDIQCVRASDACLRHDIVCNGGHTKEERAYATKKRKTVSHSVALDKLPATKLPRTRGQGTVCFAAQSLQGLESYLEPRCKEFVY